MSVPIVTSLANTTDWISRLPPRSREALKDISQFVGVDSENWKRGDCSAALTHEWFFMNFATHVTLHFRRFRGNWVVLQADGGWGRPLSDGYIIPMIINFIGDKPLM